ncbi:MAG: hypothetical protein FE834_05445, partial [Gammaproteobacteria bacterium]|nr:hypothetical protein [Gammaproteobacteria bacterium]
MLGQPDVSCWFIESVDAPVRQQCVKADKLTMDFDNSESVMAVAISTDNRFIVSAGDDGTVRRWDIKTQKCLAIQHSLSRGSFFCTDGNHKATHWNLDDWDRLYAEGRDENGETVRLSPSDYPDYANNQ